MKLARLMGYCCWIAVTVLFAGCRSPYYADRGAALGGLAGGLTGAALGDRSGHAVGGAVVGTAVGALTGAAIGDSMDAEVERREAAVVAQQRLARAVSTADVKAMAASGLGEDVIINHVRANGVAAPLTPGEIIDLHEHGVSERVINAMEQEVPRVVTPTVISGPPVVVEETYVVPPYWGPRYRYYHRPAWHPPRRHGVSWGVSYSN